KFIGDAKGLKEAGTALVHPTEEVSVECKLRDLPDEIEVDMSDLESTDSITAGDVALPEGVKMLTDANVVLATFTGSMKAAPTAEESEVGGGDGSPEVIGEKKDEDS
ncbi:MAG: 50S ribosomal protein L25, partial [Pseudomonadota bacterium]